MIRTNKIIIAVLIVVVLILVTVLTFNYISKPTDNLMQGTNNIETTAGAGGISE